MKKEADRSHPDREASKHYTQRLYKIKSYSNFFLHFSSRAEIRSAQLSTDPE